MDTEKLNGHMMEIKRIFHNVLFALDLFNKGVEKIDIKPTFNEETSHGIKRFGQKKNRSIVSAFNDATKKLNERFGNEVKTFRVDFGKYQVCIGDMWYPAILNLKSRELEIEWNFYNQRRK